MQYFIGCATLCLLYHVKSFKAQAATVLSHVEAPHSKPNLPTALIMPELLVSIQGIRIGLQTSGKHGFSVSGWQFDAHLSRNIPERTISIVKASSSLGFQRTKYTAVYFYILIRRQLKRSSKKAVSLINMAVWSHTCSKKEILSSSLNTNYFMTCCDRLKKNFTARQGYFDVFPFKTHFCSCGWKAYLLFSLSIQYDLTKSMSGAQALAQNPDEV